jgi:lipase ATG15
MSADLQHPAAPFSDRTAMVLPSLTNFIFVLYSIFFPPDVSQRPMSPLRNTLNFRLRHFHAVTPSAHVYFADGPLHSSLHPDSQPQPLSIPIAPVRTARPPSAAAFSDARALSMRGQSTALDWEEDDIMGPDVSKRETLLLLAKMTSNAYVEPDTDLWYNLTDEWDIVRSHFEWRFCMLTRGPDVRSILRLGGSRTMMVSEGTYL